MSLIDRTILEWAWMSEKGYPDINNENDLRVFESMFGFNLKEAYTEFPKEEGDISNTKVRELFKIIKSFPGLQIEDPLA